MEVEVLVRRRRYKGKTTRTKRSFRLVLVLDEETKKYHSYPTNIPTGVLDGEDIASLSVQGWEIELVFKELRDVYQLDQIQSKNPNVVKCLIWVSILTFICSRQLLRLARKKIQPRKSPPPHSFAMGESLSSERIRNTKSSPK
ncbi:transposase [Methanocella conradii]|uniref:transposase n=1 Tax=Methanocella conradii TaxID=1175444 RepID=UPI003D1863CC